MTLLCLRSGRRPLALALVATAVVGGMLACGAATNVTIPREAPDGGPVEAAVSHDATPHDAGHDARHDAGHDGGHEAGHDAGRDGGRDAGHDAGHDARIPDGSGDAEASTRDAGHEASTGTGPVLDVESGEAFSCALGTNGSVWCWGSNDMAELGRAPSASDLACGDYHCSPSAETIPVLDDAKALSLGIEFGCAIRADGSVWCWGKNDYGELGHAPGTAGDGTCSSAQPDAAAVVSACNPTPQEIPLPSGVRAAHVAAGWGLVCISTAVTSVGANDFEGDVYCWGDNAHGTVGLVADAGDIVPAPNEVSGFASDVVGVAVSIDNRYACAVRHDGSVWCWGDDYSGRIGALQGTGTDGPYVHPDPVEVKVEAPSPGGDAGDIGLGAPLSGAVAVEIGDATSCALRFDGTVWCWGFAGYAGLGNASPWDQTGQHPGARPVPGLPSTITTLVRRARGTFAIDGAGTVYAWGYDSFLELATGGAVLCAPGTDAGAACLAPPVKVAALAAPSVLATGFDTGLLVRQDAGVFAWGANEHAQLGHLPGTAGDTVCSGLGMTGACNGGLSPVSMP
jgi:alpha-tubulin suppressor-like RCC1 family protein